MSYTFGCETYDYDGPSTTTLLWYSLAFTCGGSGAQNIQEISILGYGASNIRMGVYSSDGSTLIAEGTGAVTLTGSTPSWQGHMNQASVKAAGGSSPGVLTGGASYMLAKTAGGDHHEYAQSGMAGNYRYTPNEYIGGMASAIPGTYTNVSGYCPTFRCITSDAESGQISGFMLMMDHFNGGYLHG